MRCEQTVEQNHGCWLCDNEIVLEYQRPTSLLLHVMFLGIARVPVLHLPLRNNYLMVLYYCSDMLFAELTDKSNVLIYI